MKNKHKDRAIKKALQQLDSYCQECDADVRASSSEAMIVSFCPECGSRLLKPKICIICGNPINATARFCTGCGVKIVIDKQS